MLFAIRLAEYHPNRGEGREGVSFSDIQSHFSHSLERSASALTSISVAVWGPPFLIYEGFEIRRHHANVSAPNGAGGAAWAVHGASVASPPRSPLVAPMASLAPEEVLVELSLQLHRCGPPRLVDTAARLPIGHLR